MSKEQLEGDVWQFLDGDAPTLVKDYYFGVLDNGDPTFTGRYFESLDGGGDVEGRRDRFTASDLVAVTMLSVSVPAEAAIEILDRQAARLSGLLAKIPVTLELHEPEALEHIGDSSSASQLWSQLEALPGIGWVTAGKLLARKRPHLIPVYDSVVKKALQPKSQRYWIPFHVELQNRDLVVKLRQVRGAAGLDDSISLLRVLDVAIWMRNQGLKTAGKRHQDVAALKFKARTA